jgi:hypothetical protein
MLASSARELQWQAFLFSSFRRFSWRDVIHEVGNIRSIIERKLVMPFAKTWTIKAGYMAHKTTF